jgi:hypothetical protein
MFEAKLFEVRDANTLVPVLAVRFGLSPDNDQWLYRRVGWQFGDVLVLRSDGNHPDPSPWWRQVVAEVRATFEQRQSGDLIDMRFVMGEVAEPCQSERTP